uniref:Eukaryotic translation initiation factor 3 30 kDa subunit n=1 Tax=Acrobeloides nanus TaxID=290746 RepID=A0A914BW96_9BILA
MSDDWDADDFDPTADGKLTEKLVELDLTGKAKQEEEAKKEDKSSANSKPNRTGKTPKSDRELTEKEKLELVKKSDLSMARELLGMDSDEEGGISFDKLKTQSEFEEYAENLAEKLKVQLNNKQYEHFVAYLVKKLVEPLDTFRFGNADGFIKAELKALNAKIQEKAEEEKAKLPAKQPAKTTKKKNKQMYDGYVGDEYDDFTDKYEF